MSDKLVPFGASPHDRFPPPEAPPEWMGSPAPAAGNSLKDWLALGLRHKWLLMLTMSISVGAAIYVVRTEVPVYRATASVRLIDEKRALTSGIADAPGGMLAQGTDFMQSQIQVLRSRAIASAVAERQGLRLRSVTPGLLPSTLDSVTVSEETGGDSIMVRFSDSAFTASYGGAESEAPFGTPVEIGGVRFTVTSRPTVDEAALVVVSQQAAVGQVMGGLGSRQRERSDMVDIDFTSTDPVLAARLANATAEVFQAYNAQSAQQQSRRRREFIEQQLAQTDSLLAQAQLALSDFRTRQLAFSSRERFIGEQLELMQIQARRDELRATRTMYQNVLAQLSTSDDRGRRLRSVVTVMPAGEQGSGGSELIADLYTQLLAAESSLDSLRAVGRAETDTDVRWLKDVLVMTEANLVGLLESQVGTLTQMLEGLDTQERSATARIATRPGVEAEEVALIQKAISFQTVADNLRLELQLAGMSESVEAGPVQIIDLAERPGGRVGTGRSGKLLLGLLVGLLSGIGGAFILERMNTSVRRHEEVEELLRVPRLALVPRLVPSSRLRTPFLSSGNGNGKGTAGKGVALSHIPGALVTANGTSPIAAEAYRTLRTNLIFSQAVQRIKTLVVTSAAPGEGKTTTAANLAVVYAQQGMRVLLVDCDLRRPSVHGVFGIDKEPGFTQVVMGLVDARTAVRKTAIENLFVLPSGTLPPNPAELLGGDQSRAALAALAESFDMLIVDTPPVLAAADSAILGRDADGVLMVLRVGKTERAAAQRARQQLAAVGARVVGAVLNDPDHKLVGYSAYHGYEYSYGSSEA